jgi:hypothetical protein
MKFIRAIIFIVLIAFPALAQEFKQIRDGIEYAEFSRQIKSPEKDAAPQTTIYALRLNLKKVRLNVVHAMDAAIGVERTISIASRHGAFAAINAGFFRIKDDIFKGDSTGVLQIDRKLLSESFSNRIALGIINEKDKTEIYFAHLEISYNAGIGKNTLEIDGVNRERKNDELIVYTPEFHRTTLTNTKGTEVLVINGKVAAIMKNSSNLIPSNGFVLSATGKSEELLIKSSKIGAKVRLFEISPILMLDDEKEQLEEEQRRKRLSQISDEIFKRTEDIVGGVPQLIKNGKIEITWEQEKSSKSFVETRHPRTAAAKLKDGRALLVAVDGRSAESGGMNLNELAEMLLEMGATDAMNLDGGGSTMFLDGKVVNKPSDKEGERPISNAILVTPRK